MENDFFSKLAFEMKPEDLMAGKVLISEPFLGDPNFTRSVVLLLEYSKTEGALGVIINKPLAIDMKTVVNTFPYPGFDFHYGGPVNDDNLFFIYTSKFIIAGGEKANPEIGWGGDFNDIQDKIALGEITPEEVKFFGGYSGWSAGQLEQELADKSWIIGSLSTYDIFNTDANLLWKKALKPLGKKYSLMANFPENPELN
jgi:putative transcriptional regulator